MEKTYYVICYEFFDGRREKKANAVFEKAEFSCTPYHNVLKELTQKIQAQAREEYEDIIILNISEIKIPVHD